MLHNINTNSFNDSFLQTNTIDGEPFQGRFALKPFSNPCSVIGNVAKIVLVIFLSLVTFGVIFDTLKGRRLWRTAIYNVKKKNEAIQPLLQQIIHSEPKVNPNINSVHLPSSNDVIPTFPPINTASDLKFKVKIALILGDNPGWELQVHSWNGISLEDKLWLLRVCELRQLGCTGFLLESILQSKSVPKISETFAHEILKQKASIQNFLDSITELNLSQRDLQKCPKAICLLTNLEKIDLTHNLLTIPPALNKNTKLRFVFLEGNALSVAPNLKDLTYLEEFDMTMNELQQPPDLSKNVNLRILRLGNNKLTIAPEVNNNLQLKTFDVSDNKISTLPDLSLNTRLEKIDVSHNSLTALPDFSLCPHLIHLGVNALGLTSFPDVSRNLKLQTLLLSKNKIAKCPDLTALTDLSYLSVMENPFSKAEKKKIKAFAKTRPNMFITY